MITSINDVYVACEFLAYWLGGTTRRELAALLGYGDRQITTLLRTGQDRLDGTRRYAANRKRWVADGPANKLHGPRSADQVMAVLRAINAWGHDTALHPLAPIVDTVGFNRPISPDMFAILMGACVREQAVSVRYRAKTRDLAVVFSPHTVVRALHRPHFRGYSFFEERGRGYYWDLVPSRLLDANILPHAPYIDKEGDEEWHTTTSLRLKLKPDLPKELHSALRIEYGLESDDSATIDNIPIALLRYVKSEYIERRYYDFEHNVWDIIPD